jgi:hypothetical protein
MAVFLSLTAVVGCATKSPMKVAYQHDPWPLKTTSGTKLETEHFKIFTTVNDPMFHEAVAKLAEAQYGRFHELIAAEPKQKMTVYIFSNPRQWVAFTQNRFGPELAGQYLRIRNGGYTANDIAAFYMMGRYATLTILAHELCHLYLNLATAPEPIPAWISEGLASYFEAHEWDGETPVFTPTKNLFRREQLTSALAKDRLFTIKELLNTNAGEVCRKSQERVLTYYAQLWGMMVYLQDPASPYHTHFKQLLAELGRRTMTMRIKGYLTTVQDSENVGLGEALFRVYVCNDLEQFERDCNEYLQELAGY